MTCERMLGILGVTGYASAVSALFEEAMLLSVNREVNWLSFESFKLKPSET